VSRFPTTAPRSDRQPIPRAGTTDILCIGDTHFDATTAYEGDVWPYVPRVQKMSDDFNAMVGRRQIRAVVQLGDNTTNATAVEFDAYLAWKATLNLPAGVPFDEVPGNHDLLGMRSAGQPDVTTTAQWATKMGRAAKDTYRDVGDLRLIFLSPTADSTGAASSVTRLYLDPGTLAWCEARMAETSRRCLIFTHGPLGQTVGPLVSVYGVDFSTYDPLDRWRVHYSPDYTPAQMITRSPNCIAWISGHTHSSATEYDVVKRVTYGSTSFAAISAGSPAMNAPNFGRLGNPITTALVSVRPSSIEVRYRDHGAGQWLSPVHTVTL
jgi:hypothetical protein